METVVVETEYGAVLRYPEGLGESLVQRPHVGGAQMHCTADRTTSEVLTTRNCVICVASLGMCAHVHMQNLTEHSLNHRTSTIVHTVLV